MRRAAQARRAWPTSRGWAPTARTLHGALAQLESRAGDGRRAARVAAVAPTRSSSACWGWWTRTTRSRAAGLRAAACARSSRRSSSGPAPLLTPGARRLPHRPGPALARTGCGWSTSRASRQSPWPSATAWARRCATWPRCCARSTTSPATSTATSRPGRTRPDRGLDRRTPARRSWRPTATSRRAAAARARGREGDLRVRLRRHVPARVDVRGDGRDAVADGGAGAVNSEGFLADILAEPAALRRVADAYGDGRLERMLDRPRLLLIGMGSSGYAAAHGRGGAARPRPRRPRRAGRRPATPQPAAADTLAVLISASGGSGETLEALRRHAGCQPRAGGHERRPRARSRRGGRRRWTCSAGAGGGRRRLPQLRLPPRRCWRCCAAHPARATSAWRAPTRWQAADRRRETSGCRPLAEVRGGGAGRLGERAGRAVRVGPAVGADAARGAADHRRRLRDRRLAARRRLPDQAARVPPAAAARIALRRRGGRLAKERDFTITSVGTDVSIRGAERSAVGGAGRDVGQRAARCGVVASSPHLRRLDYRGLWGRCCSLPIAPTEGDSTAIRCQS